MLDFKGGLTSSMKEEFAERTRYRQETEKYREFMIDTLYENPHYGFLNKNFEPVVTNAGSQFENLANFGDYADPSQHALPFVVKAFNGFREDFMKRTEYPGFVIPSLLGQIIPLKTYESYDEIYGEYLDNLVSMVSRTCGNTPSYLKKDRIIQSIMKTIRVFPVTQSGFVLSRHCPITTTGLSIELSNLPYSKDDKKGVILESDSYKCFLHDAKKWGFLVDRNNPWRLICDLGAPIIQGYIREYGPVGVNVDYTLARFFRRKTQYEDIQSVFNFFTKLGINNLTNSELLDYTVLIRMAETDMKTDMYDQMSREANDIYNLYRDNYPNDPYKGSASIIARYCTERLKELHSVPRGSRYNFSANEDT